MDTQIIIGIISVVSGFFIGYLTSYIKEKGKNKAILQDLEKMTEEKEKVSAKYQLDISKRRYQYESKKEQYLTFFKLIDQFTREANIKMQARLKPILEEFTSNYLEASSNEDLKAQTAAITKMSTHIQELTFEGFAELTRLKQETNTIRLIASNDIIKILDSLELTYDLLMEKSNKMMTELTSQMLNDNPEGIKENQKEIEIIGLNIKTKIEAIIQLMRLELNEI